VRADSGDPAAQAVGELTAREIEVLRMLAEGLGNKEIASRLGVTDHTIKFHISSILGKLGAASRTEAVTMGVRMGLILL
jgi:DNA-binding NarL/FixJ family response regulator